ncbi:MAG: hypothetical protein Q9163_005959 [Psora crenata]
MSLLERLPGEILVEAARFFDSESLLNFRLVNKHLSTTIHHIVLWRFFRHRNVFISVDSLDILRQVSLSEKYSALVTTLIVCMHHIPEAQHGFELVHMSSQARRMAESSHPTYTKLLSDQKWLMESGQAAAHLALALKNLPNCVNVDVSDELIDVDCCFLRSKASQLLTTNMTLLASNDFVKQLISITMAAINASGRMLDEFGIGHIGEGILIRQLPRLSVGQLGLPFSKLRSLSLILSLDLGHTRDTWWDRLCDLLKQFPSLQDLDLTFNPRLTQAEYSSIGWGLRIEGMVTLLLGCVDCHYKHFAVLLKRHRDTLRSITLEGVDLTGCIKPWRSVLELIRDETLIESIDFIFCTSDGQDIIFGAHFEDGELKIPITGSHKFREELDVVISAL